MNNNQNKYLHSKTNTVVYSDSNPSGFYITHTHTHTHSLSLFLELRTKYYY